MLPWLWSSSGRYPSLETRPLMRQQPLLAREAAAVASERSIGSDHPMAGHDHRHGIGAVCQTHRAHSRGSADALGEACVAQGLAGWDAAERLPDLQLEWRAG